MRRRLKGHKKNKGLKIAVMIFLLVLVLFLTLKLCVIIKYTIRACAQSEVEQFANESMHMAIRDACAQGVSYSELVNIYRNKEGKIESLTLNYAKVNALKSDIALRTLKYLNDDSKIKILIPIGNLTGSDFLSGLGPKIKVRIIPNSVADIDFKSSFTQAGINQVRHTVSVKITVNITALLPNYSELTKLTTDAIVTEAVIIGDVPNTYLNIGDKK